MTPGRGLALLAVACALVLALGAQGSPAQSGVDVQITVAVTNGNGVTALKTSQGDEISEHRIAYSWSGTLDFSGVPETGDFNVEGDASGKASWTVDSRRTVAGDAAPTCHAVVTNADGDLGARLIRSNGQLSIEVLGEFPDDSCASHSQTLVYPGLLFRIFQPDAETVQPLRIPLPESALKGTALSPSVPDYADHYAYTLEEDGTGLDATDSAQVRVASECLEGASCGHSVILEDDRNAEPPAEPAKPLADVLVQVSGSGSVSAADIRCGVAGVACYAQVTPGTTVSLRASASHGHRFVGWTGACSGRRPVCTVAASDATSVGASFVPARGRAVHVSLARASLSVRWLRSVGTGSLVARGAVGRRATLRVQLLRPEGARLLGRTVRVRRGAFSLRAALASSAAKVLPGGYVISLTGTSGGARLPLQLRAVSLPAPPEGVVRAAFMSTSRGGSPEQSVPAGTHELWATFRFAAQPTASPLEVSWYQDGRLIGAKTKNSRPSVETGIRAPAGLPSGRYRVDLTAGARIVDELSVTIG